MASIKSPLLNMIHFQASRSVQKLGSRSPCSAIRSTSILFPRPARQAPTAATTASITTANSPYASKSRATSYLRQYQTPPPVSSPPSSFFTPSLCRIRSTQCLPRSTRAFSTYTNLTLTPSAPFSTSTTRFFPSSLDTSQPTSLTWNAFFTLRTRQRLYSLLSSTLFAIGTTVSGLILLTSTPLPDTLSTISSLDPVLTSGICTVLSFTIGWLIGPFFGQALWRLLNRGTLMAYVAKEKDFFQRVRRYRVDPSGASTTNPVPDYYGEKVGSVAGYRRWLKDQRAFNRKKGGKA